MIKKNKKINIIIFISNFLLIGSLITYTILFNLKIKIEILPNLIIILSILALLAKTLHWYIIKDYKEKKIKKFLLRFSLCIFTYITPLYYMLQKPSLVINENVVSVTLILTCIIAGIGMLIEKFFYVKEPKILYSNSDN